MAKSIDDTRLSGRDVAREILGDIVENFVLTEDRGSLFKMQELSEDKIRGKKITVVERMLLENPDGKAALGQLYGEAINAAPETSSARFLRWGPHQTNHEEKKDFKVFIESGSTLLFVSHALRQVFAGTQNSRISVRTNNHLTAWLYLNKRFKDGLVPFLFSGALEEKYHGIFPFLVGGAPGDREEERIAYAQCRRDMAGCDLLLLAASRLSLCLGPLVGSRENAILKHASYSACVPRLGDSSPNEIHLMITSDKLVAHTSKKACHTISEELEKVKQGKCFPVFDLRPREGSADGGSVHLTKCPFSEYLRPRNTQPLKDGTQAVRVGDSRFRICDTWGELLTKGGLRICVFISHREKERPWIEKEIEFARNHFGGEVDLVLHEVTHEESIGYSMSCLVIEGAGGDRG